MPIRATQPAPMESSAVTISVKIYVFKSTPPCVCLLFGVQFMSAVLNKRTVKSRVLPQGTL